VNRRTCVLAPQSPDVSRRPLPAALCDRHRRCTGNDETSLCAGSRFNLPDGHQA